MEEAPTKPEQSERAEVAPVETKPKKEKKPATPAQQAARDKGLAVMMAKRRELAEKQNAKKEEIKKAKKVVEDKILKEDLAFVTRQDYEARLGSISKELAELKALHAVAQQQKEKPVAAPKPERIVERVIERVPTPSAQPQKLSGHALLDSIFFNK